jgi:hypothetical protein
MAHFLLKQDLEEEENSELAVTCLNDMVTNALTHATDALQYMSALRDPAIFRFCAIPQVGFVILFVFQWTTARSGSPIEIYLYAHKLSKKTRESLPSVPGTNGSLSSCDSS